MNTRSNGKRWTEKRARGELERWKRSGQSMAAYASKRGYQAQRLSWWRKRLGNKTSPTRATPVTLAPAVITETRAPVMVLIDDQGVRVELEDPAALPPSWIADVMAAMGRGAAA